MFRKKTPKHEPTKKETIVETKISSDSTVDFPSYVEESELVPVVDIATLNIAESMNMIDCLLYGNCRELCDELESVLSYGHTSDFSRSGLSEAGYKFALISVLKQALNTHPNRENIEMFSEVLLTDSKGNRRYVDLLLLSEQFCIVFELKYVRLEYLYLKGVQIMFRSDRDILSQKQCILSTMAEDQILGTRSKMATSSPQASPKFETIKKQLDGALIQGVAYSRIIRFEGIEDDRVEFECNQTREIITIALLGVGCKNFYQFSKIKRC